NSDSISVIDTAADTVLKVIDVRPDSSAPLGSAPNAIAISEDGQTLYVANAGNNAVAVIQPSASDPIRGFIPVGWFPTALALTKTNDRLLIGNGYVSVRLRRWLRVHKDADIRIGRARSPFLRFLSASAC